MSKLFWISIVWVVAVLATNLRPAYAAQPSRVPVLLQTVYPGQSVDASMLSWQMWTGDPRHLHGMARNFEDLLGLVARRTLLPGKPIHLSSMRRPNAVRHGQLVTLIFSGHAISIQGRGIALKSGRIGDWVEVRNIDSGRSVFGQIESGGVRIGGKTR